MIELRILLNEIREKHRIKLRPLFHRHRAGVGYCILALGVTVALWLSAMATNVANERAERQAAVICQNTIVADQQALTNLVTKSGHELIKDFHLTLPQAAALIHKQLESSAQERKRLQPSRPRSACTGKLTTIPIRPRIDKASVSALKLAEKPMSVAKGTHSMPSPLAEKRTSTPQRFTRAPAIRRPLTSPLSPRNIAPPTPSPSGKQLPKVPVEPSTGTPEIHTQRTPTIEVPPIEVGPVATSEIKIVITTSNL